MWSKWGIGVTGCLQWAGCGLLYSGLWPGSPKTTIHDSLINNFAPQSKLTPNYIDCAGWQCSSAGRGEGEVLHQIFCNQVQHSKKKMDTIRSKVLWKWSVKKKKNKWKKGPVGSKIKEKGDTKCLKSVE